MTLTTVGYGIPENISPEGKLFTVFLMLFGIGMVFYGLTALSVEFISGNLLKEYKKNKIKNKMYSLQNHTIICGFGRNGSQVAKKLETYQKKYVVIDKELTLKKEQYKNAIFVQGNSVDDAILEEAGIKRASALITTLPSDADNLFIVITARQANPSLKIISRASESKSVEKLKIAGANNVVLPHKIGGDHMASLLVTPDLVEFIDNINIEGSSQNNLLEINTKNINNEYIGKKLIDLNIKTITGCNTIGYKTSDSKYIINPDDNQIIEPNSYIIVLGKPEQIELAKNKLINN